MKKLANKVYNSIFNSKGTAVICVMLLSGLAVQGLFALIGENSAQVAVSIMVVVLLVNKILNKVLNNE